MSAIQEHLSNRQISEYQSGVLTGTESNEIGKHLLKCGNCRNMLPIPSGEKFWTELITERHIEETAKSAKLVDSSLSFFSVIFGVFNRPSVLMFSAAAIVVFFGLPFLIWHSVEDRMSLSGEVAQIFDRENGETSSRVNEEPKTLKKFPADGMESGISSKKSNSKRKGIVANEKISSNPSKKERLSSVSQRKSNRNARQINSYKNRDNISLIRGSSLNCTNEIVLEMEIGKDREAVVLKWKKVKNAAKYHVFISDDDEILVDEYETEEDTTYSIKNNLDPTKLYRWKLIVTLENGQRVVGDSQNFSANDTVKKRSKFENKRRGAIRCPAKS